MLKHKQSEGFPFMFVNGVFLFFFIAIRGVFMGWALVRNYQIQQKVDIFSDPPLIATFAVLSTAMQVALWSLQLFWIWQILGAFMKVLKG